MGIENLSFFKAEIEGHWKTPVPRAYIFVPNIDPDTTYKALTKFRKHLKWRSVGYYTSERNWTHGFNPIAGDLICFYHGKDPLFFEGLPLEEIFDKELGRKKLMMVFEGKDCYEILEAR